MKNLIEMQRKNPNYDLKLSEKEIESLKKSVPEANSIEECISFYNKEWHKMFSHYKTKGNKRKPYRKWYALNWEYKSFKDLMKAVDVDEAFYHFFMECPQ